jgi:hypothetical protein
VVAGLFRRRPAALRSSMYVEQHSQRFSSPKPKGRGLRR